MTTTRTINRPIPFSGTPEEAEANLYTHQWDYADPTDPSDMRCFACDSKPWHAAAKYPCGVEPPRETVVVEVAE